MIIQASFHEIIDLFLYLEDNSGPILYRLNMGCHEFSGPAVTPTGKISEDSRQLHIDKYPANLYKPWFTLSFS
jgi:hypothetical protein